MSTCHFVFLYFVGLPTQVLFFGAQHVLDTVLSNFFSVIAFKILRSRYNYQFHFIDEASEPRGVCLRSHSQ
jgi:hypothetical protein